MGSGTLWIALWLGLLAGGMMSPGAAGAQPAPAQTAAPPNPQTADMSITAHGGAKGMPAVGALVTYTLAVANAGPSEGNRALVSLAPNTANISVEHVRGACDALPCYLRPVAPGDSPSVMVDLRILSAGPFGFTARVHAVEPDPDQANNVAVVSVTPPTPTPTPSATPSAQASTTPLPPECPGCGPPPPPSWRDWLTPTSLTAAGSLLLLPALVGAAIVRRRRRGRWLERLTVTADPGPEPGLATGPIPLAGPVVTLSVRCEAGKSGPLGPVPILGVTYDD